MGILLERCVNFVLGGGGVNWYKVPPRWGGGWLLVLLLHALETVKADMLNK